MTKKNLLSPVTRLKAIPAINMGSNLAAVILTLVYFALIEPGIGQGSVIETLWDRTKCFVLVVAVIWAGVMPVNMRIFYPVFREVKKAFSTGMRQGSLSANPQELHYLAGRLLNLPVKLGISTMCGWAAASAILLLLPLLWPGFVVWDVITSHKIVFSALVMGAVTAIFIYFLIECWIRETVRVLFPYQALQSVPPFFRISVLAKILIVSLMVGIVPVSMVGHETLHYVHEIQAGRQTIEAFLSHVPMSIVFLLALFVPIAVGLSLLMAHSVSEPLRHLRSAMEQIQEGDLKVSVNVVSNDEIGVMAEGFNRMVEEHRELDSIRDTFGRYLSEEVVAEILKSRGGVELRGEMREMTVLVADLRGFTAIAESLPPRQVLEVINRYLEKMTDIIIRHEGTIDEFTGDGILVFFGAPRPLSDHADRAVVCAVEMQESMEALNKENLRTGLPELQMGIGINCGELIVGNIGSEKRKKYGAVGSPINIAFRVEDLSRGSEILLTPTVHHKLADKLITGSTRQAHLKGIEYPMDLYQVTGWKAV